MIPMNGSRSNGLRIELQTEFAGILSTPRLPAAAGHNRFIWDYALPGPWDANASRSGRNGPLALPGRYTVRLTAGGRTMSEPLVVVPEVRGRAAGARHPAACTGPAPPTRVGVPGGSRALAGPT